MSEEIILKIDHLKQYFPVHKKDENGNPLFVKAVDDVSLDIKRGEVIGLVGDTGQDYQYASPHQEGEKPYVSLHHP